MIEAFADQATCGTQVTSGMVETLEERLLVLRWFAGIFREAPSEETAKSLTVGAGADFIDGLCRDPDLCPDLTYLKGLIAGEANARALTERLGVTFGHLFLGVGGPNTVPPYESCHIEESGRTFGLATAEMEALMRDLDLSLASDFREPVDHISVELEIAALLIATADPQAHAMLIRLNRWMTPFAQACFSRDPFGFYAAAASALRAFIARESRALSAPTH